MLSPVVREDDEQGNVPESAVVDLARPLGDRSLVDGACLSGEAVSTATCVEGAQRWP